MTERQLLIWLGLGTSFTLMGCSEEEGQLVTDGGGGSTTRQVKCAELGDGNPDESTCCSENSKYMSWNATANMWLGCCQWNPDSNQCQGGEACTDFKAATFAGTSSHDYSQQCSSDRWICQKTTADDVCAANWRAARDAIGGTVTDPATYCPQIQTYGQCLKNAQCCVSGDGDSDAQIQKFNEALSYASTCLGSNAITNPCSNMSICAGDVATTCASAYTTATSGASDAATVCPEFQKYSQCLKDAGCCGASTSASFQSAVDAIFMTVVGNLCTGTNAVTNPCNPDLKPPCSATAATNCANAWASTFQSAPTDPTAAAAALCPELEQYTKCLKDASCCDDSVAGQAAKTALDLVVTNVGNQYCTGSNAITNQCT